MKRTLPILLTPLLVVALLVSSSACGTIGKFSSSETQPNGRPLPPRAFGGVADDFQGIVQPAPVPDYYGLNPIIRACLVIDICLSAVGDTVTLPFVIFRSWEDVLKQPSNPHIATPTKESDNALTLPPVKLSTEPPAAPEPIND